MASYGFHCIHGRALAAGTALKVARPDLNVIVFSGDGDIGDSIEPVQAFVPYEDQLEVMAEARGDLVEIGRYTIDISSAAADQEMELILDAIDAEIEGSNHPTLVHCMNGNGYTGMVVGCYLARHGIAAGKDVLAKIRELRAVDPNLVKAKSPENMIQERFVIRWKAGQ